MLQLFKLPVILVYKCQAVTNFDMDKQKKKKESNNNSNYSNSNSNSFYMS